jgi:hypothetical protein
MNLKKTGCEDVNRIYLVLGKNNIGNCEHGNEIMVLLISANILKK